MKMFNTQTQPLQPRPSNKSLKTPAATPLAVVLLAVKATHTGRQAAIAINLRAEIETGAMKQAVPADYNEVATALLSTGLPKHSRFSRGHQPRACFPAHRHQVGDSRRHGNRPASLKTPAAPPLAVVLLAVKATHKYWG